MQIDVSFDFQAEAGGRDSDRYSPTLQEYHRILWSKLLPNGQFFDVEKINNNRLYHKSALGEFYLSSDRAITTFWKRKSFEHITSKMPTEQLKEFDSITDTIGGIVIWPSNRIGNRQTINGARGFNRMISDRLDLTIECIRLYYNGKTSPLYGTFDLYKDFFELFENFEGFIKFFLMQDAVSEDYSKVKISAPFDDFKTSPVPGNVDEYRQYMVKTLKFVKLRNRRIAEYASHHK
ncbi:MAG: hypothetical protein M3P98_00885 [bacterium]|nr:hypothetical protein [bacterium]